MFMCMCSWEMLSSGDGPDCSIKREVLTGIDLKFV